MSGLYSRECSVLDVLHRKAVNSLCFESYPSHVLNRKQDAVLCSDPHVVGFSTYKCLGQCNHDLVFLVGRNLSALIASVTLSSFPVIHKVVNAVNFVLLRSEE